MLATLTDGPFDDADWVFEDKYDGFRMVAVIEVGSVALYSRNGKVVSHSYREIATALQGIKGGAVIDGELVALDEAGISHFQLLQNALRDRAKLRYFRRYVPCRARFARDASARAKKAAQRPPPAQ